MTGLISEIVKKITETRLSVFCGAGISFNSGLPIVSALLDYLFEKLQLTKQQINLIWSSNLPFESIMEKILDESGLNEIQEIFSAGAPSTNHYFISKLAKKGLLKTICTTNFDTLIEDALQQEGLIDDKDFKVYSSESEINNIVWTADIIHLIKIHGCIKNKDEMAITMSLIASDRYSEMRRKVLQEIFTKTKHDNVIVMGYSCSDMDLVPLIESLEENTPFIYFIEHSVSVLKKEYISLKGEKNPFKKYDGVRIYINTDKLVKDIWKKLFTEEYQNTTSLVTNWKANINEWYANSIEESGEGVQHHIAARLLYAIGEFHEAIEHNKRAISIALRNNNLKAYSAEIGNMGMAFNALRNFEQAKFCLSESIPLCKRLGYVQNLSAQLQTLGNILHHTGYDVEAIKNHKEALKYAEEQNDEFAISNILGNISNSYNRLGEFHKTIFSVNRALQLSRRVGNLQAESSQLGIIATAYIYTGHLNKAIECCLRAVKIKRSIGDRHGECILLGNLVSLYRQTDNPQDAHSTARECIILAKKLGNKQIEQMVMLNLALLK